MNKIDERLIKIMASAIPIDAQLTLGDDVVLKVIGTVVKEVSDDNNDGTYNLTYIVKGIVVEEIS